MSWLATAGQNGRKASHLMGMEKPERESSCRVCVLIECEMQNVFSFEKKKV